jgi:hypothetical protein
MAPVTQALEVCIVVRAATGERNLVVYLLGGSQSALSLADLAQRMGGDVTVTDTLPRFAVTFLAGRVTVVFVVPSHLQLLMFLAETSVRQFGTAGVTAWALGFIRHDLPSRHKAPPALKAPRAFIKMATAQLTMITVFPPRLRIYTPYPPK